jgi:hypothetical protein
MGRVALDGLIRHTESLEGIRIRTAGGRAWFTVRVADRGLEYTPESTGIPRLHTTKFIARILERHSRTGSLRPGDYSDISKNVSYILALVASYLGNSS